MGSMRGALLLVLLSLCVPAMAQREERRPKKREAVEATKEPQAKSGKSAAAELRAEWEVADLKLTREAVDDTSFTPAVKSAAVEALETFISEQQQLLKLVEQSPETEPKARKQRAKMQQAFMQRMAVVNENPQLKRELTTSVRALNKEIDEIAQSANALFSRLEQVGLTAEQRQKLKPVVEDANQKVRGAVEKSKTKSTKDRLGRDEVVDTWKESRKKVKQHLTPEQREKLKQKLAEA
jgi:hypothetical protein